jgi:hypothetical protein
MKKLVYISLLAFALLSVQSGFAQTNVSGSIHSSTTWTLSNSPYHVTANIIVFPGVTLTIEPGVKVIFDGNYTLEVRGKIDATGTATNKIYFCGKMIINNNDTFYAYWEKVLIEPSNKGTGTFKYCVFKDANTALEVDNAKAKIEHCLFENNTIGIYGYNIYNSSYETISDCVFQYNSKGVSSAYNTIFKNCVFNHNDQGIYVAIFSKALNCTYEYNRNGINIFNGNIYNSTFYKNTIGLKSHNFDGGFSNIIDTLYGCNITYNEVGIDDSAGGCGQRYLIINNTISFNDIGYRVFYAGDITEQYPAKVKYNKICHNFTYNVVNTNKQNKNFTDNCFCTDDSVVIENKIFDGYDDSNLGLITYNIYDTACESKLSNTFKNLPVQDKDTGCLDFATCVKYTSIHDVKATVQLLKLYPNPATNGVSIQLNSDAAFTINIYDQFGRLVYAYQSNEMDASLYYLDITDWSNGMYCVEVIQNDSKSLGKFLKY